MKQELVRIEDTGLHLPEGCRAVHGAKKISDIEEVLIPCNVTAEFAVVGMVVCYDDGRLDLVPCPIPLCAEHGHAWSAANSVE